MTAPEPLLERTQRVIGLMRILTPREFRTRYRQSILDVGWSLLTPIAVCAVYGIVLTRSFDVDASCSPYLSSAWIGVVLWTFFATALGTATWSLLSSADLLGKVYFPREAIPLSVVGATIIDLAVGLVTVVVVVLVQGVAVTPIALTSFLAILVLVVWTSAISVVAAVVAVFVRDVNHAVQLFLRVGFFATPVMYESNFVPEALAWTTTVNPVAVAIDGVRDPLLCGKTPALGELLVHLAAGTLLLVVGVLYTRAVERRIVDVI